MDNTNRHRRTQLWSACLGNLFEHYDTALFGFLSPFLAPLIFPKEDPVTALILTYAMIPLGMLARPLGSIIFGYIGDLYGRERALFLSLAGMSLVSGGIALTPTYTDAGIIAPIAFCVGRLLQNLLAAGESMGGAIYLLENTAKERHDFLSSIYNATTVGGILLASAGVAVIAANGHVETGWRILYMLGCATGIFGCLIRWQAPAASGARAVGALRQNMISMGTGLWTSRRQFLLVAINSGLAYANYSIALVLLNGFIPLISPITETQMMNVNTTLLIVDFAALPLFGWVASKISREKIMLFAAASIAVFAAPLFLVLENASLFTAVAVRLCFVFAGVAFFAPFHAWAMQLVPPAHRYAVISLGYALGSQLLGGPTAAISLWCFKQTGIVASASWYWAILAGANVLAIALSLKRDPKPRPLEAPQ